MMSQLLLILWLIIQLVIFYQLFFPFFLFLIYKIKGGAKAKTTVSATKQASYAIIVTAYEQTSSLPAVVRSILKLNYSNYIVYIVADKCDVSNLKFNDDRVVVLRPPETLASNTRSHFYAIRNFIQPHERLTIIDSDNLVDDEYLNELDVFFAQGYEAVQGIRLPKNLDTTLACLDAARDIYYHFYDGNVLFGVGSSSTLSGSGMAFTTKIYRDCLEHLDITGAGFDKVLQAELLKRNVRIAFTDKAIVYDEKTTQSDQLVNQRARWINTWFKYFGFGFSIFFRGLFRFNLNQIVFGLVLLRPPLFIFLILSFMFMVANLFINPWMSLAWAIGLAVFTGGFALALSSSHTDKRIIKSLSNIPKFMLLQIVSLSKSLKANKRSVATKHYHNADLDEMSEK